MTTIQATHPTLADLARPRTTDRAIAYDLFAVGVGALAIALATMVKVPMPWGLPLTLQTFAIMVLAFAMGPGRVVGAVAVYMGLGLLGVGVFTVLQPLMTAGFLAAFGPAAWVGGMLARRGWDRSPARLFVGMFVCGVLVLACGAAWLSVLALSGRSLADGSPLTLEYAWLGAFVYFLPIEAAKAGVAAAVLPAVWKRVGASR